MIQLPNQSLALGKPLGIQIRHRNRYKFCSYTTNAASQSADIKLSLPTGKEITIHWGDGTSTVVTGAVTTTTYSHTYTDIGTYNLTVSGDYNDITYLRFSGDGSYGGDIKYFPSELLLVLCPGDNTFYGSTENFPSKLQKIEIWGQTSITGNLLYCPITLTSITLIGYNTLSGNFQTFLNLIYAKVYGANTISDSLSNLQNGLTDFFIQGHNTYYGDLATLPDTLKNVYIRGWNTISEYTGKTWTNNFNYFVINPYSGGLSSVEIDQLIIDLDNDLDWSGGGIIYLTGTNAPRTSASDDAVNNIEAEGGTIFTN